MTYTKTNSNQFRLINKMIRWRVSTPKTWKESISTKSFQGTTKTLIVLNNSCLQSALTRAFRNLLYKKSFSMVSFKKIALKTVWASILKLKSMENSWYNNTQMEDVTKAIKNMIFGKDTESFISQMGKSTMANGIKIKCMASANYSMTRILYYIRVIGKMITSMVMENYSIWRLNQSNHLVTFWICQYIRTIGKSTRENSLRMSNRVKGDWPFKMISSMKESLEPIGSLVKGSLEARMVV